MITWLTAAGANQVVSTGPAILKRIIIGRDVANAQIEVANHKTDGDTNVLVDLAGSTLMTPCGGFVDVGDVFDVGITVDLTNQTMVGFVWEPTVT